MPRSTPLASLLPLLLLALATPAAAADVTVTLGATDGFVVEDNTATIERLRIDEATGNVSRNGALFVHTTGTNNTFVGEGAGNTATTGYRNSAFGRELYEIILLRIFLLVFMQQFDITIEFSISHFDN